MKSITPTEFSFPRHLPAQDLQLGDRVQLDTSTFACATVVQILDGMITFFRPYCMHDRVVLSGNHIMAYVGVEKFSVPINKQMYYVLDRDKFMDRDLTAETVQPFMSLIHSISNELKEKNVALPPHIAAELSRLKGLNYPGNPNVT